MERDKKLQVLAHGMALIFTVCVLLPLLILISSSFTDDKVLLREGYNIFPRAFSLDAYTYLFDAGSSILRSYGISILLMVLGTTISLLITTPLAYVISRPRLTLRGPLTFMVFFTMLFHGGLVPTYVNYVNVFHLKNTFWALLIPNLLMPAIYVLLMKNYFQASVPNELLEAASIDGAGEFRCFLSVAVPLAKPIIATVALFVGMGYWNDWQNGYIYLSKRTDLYSIQTLLNAMMRNIQFLSENQMDMSSSAQAISEIPSTSVRMAIAFLGILPILVIYPLVQKNIVKGITLGAVKG